MKTYRLDVQLSKQEDGLWRAEVPGLQGCFADGPTLQMALHDVQEVAAMLIDLATERGETLPASVCQAEAIGQVSLPLVLDEHSFKNPASRARSAVR